MSRDIPFKKHQQFIYNVLSTKYTAESVEKTEKWSPPGDVGLGDTQHVDGGLVQLDEDTVEDLAQTQQLQNLTHFRAHTVDTAKELTQD